MLLSRFWYLIVALALGAAVAGLYVATSTFNRTSREAMDQSLAADTQVVRWFMNDDVRRRSSLLLGIVLDESIRTQLSKASSKSGKIPTEVQAKTREALSKLADSMPKDSTFTALFAVDQFGRVVGQVGFDQASGIADFELGGYPLVADALHGWVRDDTWVLDGRIYLAVARPVEVDTSQMPAGAVVGLRIVDASYAREISKRTGMAVGFYAGGTIKAKAAPEGFDPSKLDTIVADIKNLDSDEQYKAKGKSKPKVLMGDVGVIYSKIPGEAWDLGAGYVVGRAANVVSSPLAFVQAADEQDKKSVPWALVGVVFVVAVGAGLLFSVLEHTRPLRVLRAEAERFAKGDIDMLQVSKFRGGYRKIASDLNDGTEKVAAKGGAPRKAADLESVLGPIPAQPSMSAFSFPMDGPPADRASGPGTQPSGSRPMPPPPKPEGIQLPPPVAATDDDAKPVAKEPSIKLPPPKPEPTQQSAGVPSSKNDVTPEPSVPRLALSDDDDQTVVSAVPKELLAATASGSQEAEELSEWRKVYEDFVQTKNQCGEPTAGLTFEKFKSTLRKNRDQLIAKTSCTKVKFSVYVKDGRAALKASPIRA